MNVRPTRTSFPRKLSTLLATALLALGATTLAASPATAAAPPAVGGGTGIVFSKSANPVTSEAWICTLTAVGRDDAGRLIALTNAHCFLDAAGNKLTGINIYLDSSPAGTSLAPAPTTSITADLTTGVIGQVTYVSEPNNLVAGGPFGMDYAVIQLDESKVIATKTVGGVTINSVGAPPAFGTTLCKMGHRTGITCGAKLIRNGIWFSHTVWTMPGDSGSPVVAGTTLVGNAWGFQLSTPIVDIIADITARGGVGAGFEVTT